MRETQIMQMRRVYTRCVGRNSRAVLLGVTGARRRSMHWLHPREGAFEFGHASAGYVTLGVTSPSCPRVFIALGTTLSWSFTLIPIECDILCDIQFFL